MPDITSGLAQTIRQRAEEKFKSAGGLSSKMLSPAEIDQLFHELQVHQIELEMQNEDLRCTQHDLEISRADYFDLYEMAPVGYLTVSEHELIQKANLFAVSMFGIARNALLNKPLSDFIFREDQDKYYLHRKKAFNPDEKHVIEIRMVRTDGSLFWAHLQATQQQNGEQWITLIDVSELRQVENDLRESNAYLNSLFDYANVPIIVWDNNFRITRFNKAFEVLTGKTSSEVIGCSISILFPADQIYNSMHLIRNATLSGLEAIEIPISHVNGSISNLLWNSATIFDKDGTTPVATIAQGHNITKRKQAEDKMRKSEEHFRAIFDLSNVGKSMTTPDGKLLKVNRAFADMVGYSIDEMQQLDFTKITHPDDMAKSFECIRNLISGKQSKFRFEKRYIHKSGAIVWGDVSTTMLHDEQGAPFHLITTIIDITDRKLAEEQIARAKEDWERTFDAVPDLIALIDNNHIIIRVNKALAERCGHTPDEMIGLKCHEVMHGMSDPPIFCPQVSMLEDGLWHRKEIYEKQLNGSFDISVAPLYDTEGQIIACVQVARDISESKHLEEERIILEQQFQQAQKLESLGILSGGIAHDFNNILSIIIGNCCLLQQRPAMVAEFVPEIETAAQRAADLCRQMLIYAGKAQPVSTKINLKTLIEEMVKMLKATINQNVAFTLDFSSDIPSIKADASQIRQVVMNLIINASEAIGTEQGNITVSLANAEIEAGQNEKDYLGKVIPPGSYICLNVADNGCGMDEEAKSRLFEPFYTTKITGRGLGMSALLGIITAHHGALQLNSQKGVGTTFEVYLPVQRGEPVEDLLSPVSLMPWKGSGTVLLVEDEPQLRMLAKELIETLGFNVIEAANGQVALEVYQKNAQHITLILTDIGMPVMDGHELIRKLKLLNPKLPIIVSSGFGVAEATSSIREDIGCVSKPYSFDQLREVLKGVVEGEKTCPV